MSDHQEPPRETLTDARKRRCEADFNVQCMLSAFADHCDEAGIAHADRKLAYVMGYAYELREAADRFIRRPEGVFGPVKPNKQLAARLVNELDPWQRAKELIDDYRLLLLADCEDAGLKSKCDDLYRSFLKALQECAAAEWHHMDVAKQQIEQAR